MSHAFAPHAVAMQPQASVEGKTETVAATRELPDNRVY